MDRIPNQIIQKDQVTGHVVYVLEWFPSWLYSEQRFANLITTLFGWF